MAGKPKPSSYRYRGITIRDRILKDGKTSRRVECPLDWFGRVAFKQFKTKAAAEAFIDRELDELANYGSEASDFTLQERADALKALRTLKGTGATLASAAEFFIKHNRPAGGDISTKALITEYLDRMARGVVGKRGKVPRTRSLGDVSTRLTKFELTNGSTLAKDLSAHDLQAWIYREEWSGQTQLNYFRVLHALFAYAIKSKYLASNPLKDVPRPSPDQKTPGKLTVAEFERLLIGAAQGDSDLLAFATLGGFCGIRPAELGKLAWDHVNLEEKFVTVPPEIAKGRSIRNVAIPDCAIEWLILCKPKTGPIANPKNFRKRWDRLREGAELLATWPHDALRHSAGSYKYALHNDSAATAAMLGHPNDTLLFEHYRALTTKKEAERFYGLLPAKTARRKVINLKTVGL